VSLTGTHTRADATASMDGDTDLAADCALRSSVRCASYDRIADWYCDQVRSGSLIHEAVVPAILDLAGDVRERRVCDVACGEGVLARALARAGADVVAIDVSRGLLKHASAEERRLPLGIEYADDDAECLATLGSETFDGAVNSLALTDIQDLSATAQSITRVLRPGGWFVFAINHPCGPASAPAGRLVRAPSDYFREGRWQSTNPDSVRGRVGAYHRTLSTYLNTLTAAGLDLERSVEPRATGALVRRTNGYDRVPATIVQRWRKRDG
jgi:2-polyprenyl-3-methyl-5-hydroxy-6-metoxy-1,4-benzoquinol methylase